MMYDAILFRLEEILKNKQNIALYCEVLTERQGIQILPITEIELSKQGVIQGIIVDGVYYKYGSEEFKKYIKGIRLKVL